MNAIHSWKKGISFEVRALVTLSKSWYFDDSEKVYVVCQLVNLCHGVIHMSWLVESKRMNVHPSNEEVEPCDCLSLEMLASIQVSFRVVVRRLRTNNEFKLRVLIYREFTVFLIHFTYKLCVSRAFVVLVFMCFYHILQERCSGAEV